jgi:general secretion pathway protein H
MKTGGDMASARFKRGFTLIEIMVVVAIMGVIMGMSIPSVMMAMRQESVRKAANDLKEACLTVRGRAIMSGQMTTLNFYPQDRKYDGGAGVVGVLPEDLTIEMLSVNLREFKEWDKATVRFFPNGTSDEMTVVYRSAKNEWRRINLEVTTGLPAVETDMSK